MIFRIKQVVTLFTIGCAAYFTFYGNMPAYAQSNSEIVGDVVQEYLLDPDNSESWGLAYNGNIADGRLYVSDASNKIFSYKLQKVIDGEVLLHLSAEDIVTTDLHPRFSVLRDLAYALENGHSYLYALTSNDDQQDGILDPLLWRIDLDNPSAQTTEFINLALSAFGIGRREVYGLTYHAGDVYISYDPSDMVHPYRHGILVFNVNGSNWADAQNGNPSVFKRHMADSGNHINHGLAYMSIGTGEYLWGSANQGDDIYVADLQTGRGIFEFSSPGIIYGLEEVNGYLWAVANNGTEKYDHVYKINVSNNVDVPYQGPKHVIHLEMSLLSSPNVLVDSHLKHYYASPPSQSYRKNQDIDAASESIHHNGGATWNATSLKSSYDPAGDSAARQYYHEVEFSGSIDAQEEPYSFYDVDLWTSDYHHYVYPHLCDSSGADQYQNYTDDDYKIFRLSDTSAYSQFWEAIDDAMVDKYGAYAHVQMNNPFWRARSIVEFILENYAYHDYCEPAIGLYCYNPANLKLRLYLDDPNIDHIKMACSAATFSLIGLCRYAGIPARWVGTTRRRGNWDANNNGLWERNEYAIDEDAHRWAEVWLGETYGWQRFDPQPSTDSGDWFRDMPQFKHMGNTAEGVENGDIIVTVGSGYHEQFFKQKTHDQDYNVCARYNDPGSWESDIDQRKHSNACFIDLTAPSGELNSEVFPIAWTCDGRWDLDPSSTVSVKLQPMDDSGLAEEGDPHVLASGLAYNTGAWTVDLTPYGHGFYKIKVIKDGDTRTGAEGPVFQWLPDLITTLSGVTVDENGGFDNYRITLNTRIQNNGNAPSGDFNVYWFGSPVYEPEIIPNDQMQPVNFYPQSKTVPISSMNPGDSIELSNTWLVDKVWYDSFMDGNLTGLFYLSCYADNEDLINELHENNNIAVYSQVGNQEARFIDPTQGLIQITGIPQKDVEAIEAAAQAMLPEILDAFSRIDMTWIVINDGDLDVLTQSPGIVIRLNP